MERHVCGHFAAPKGPRKTDRAKRQRVGSAGDAFDAIKDAEQQQRTPSTSLQRGRLYRAMNDATFGVVDKVVPYLRFWAFGSVTRCAFSHTIVPLTRTRMSTIRSPDAASPGSSWPCVRALSATAASRAGAARACTARVAAAWTVASR